jgi:hypothetical protein
MENVKGLFFDVGGTVFDWKNTAREKILIITDFGEGFGTLPEKPK